MRICIKNRIGAYMTVEAAIVIPLMLFSFVLFVYMTVFVYDRTLLMQDTYTMSVYAKEDCYGKEDVNKQLDGRFQIFKEEHPYLALSDISMSITKKHNVIKITSGGNFETPFGKILFSLFLSKDEVIRNEKEVKLLDPTSVLLKTEDMLGWKNDYIQHKK